MDPIDTTPDAHEAIASAHGMLSGIQLSGLSNEDQVALAEARQILADWLSAQ